MCFALLLARCLTHSYSHHLFSLFNWQYGGSAENFEKQKKSNFSHMKGKKHKNCTKLETISLCRSSSHQLMKTKRMMRKTTHLAEPLTTPVTSVGALEYNSDNRVAKSRASQVQHEGMENERRVPAEFYINNLINTRKSAWTK